MPPPRHIPPRETRRWTGPYLGNYYGTLWKTFNVDLDRNEGKVMLSRRMERIESDSEFSASNYTISAFLRSDADSTDRYWALGWGGPLFKTDSAQPENSVLPSDDWDSDPLDSSPTDARDFTISGNDSRNDSGKNKLFVTTGVSIKVLNDTGDNTWNKFDTLTFADIPHPIEYFPFRKITVMGDGNLIHTITRPSDTQNDTFQRNRLVLPRDLFARHIFTTQNRTWILCYNRFGGEGAIVEWDGSAVSYNNIYSAYSQIPILGWSWKDIPMVVNNRGYILEFTGNGFTQMIRNGQTIAFPIAEEEGNSFSAGVDSSATFETAPRGAVVGEDNLVYMNMGNAQGYRSDRFMGGIWCLNPQTGRLYNKHSFSDSVDSADYGQQEYDSLNAARAGGVSAGGGIYWVPSNVTTRNILAGKRTLKSATSDTTGIIWLQEAATTANTSRGYFITQYVPADEIKELFDTIWIKFRRFINSDDTIVIKARGVRPLVVNGGGVLQGTITWTSTTTFTITLASADDALQIGDEVEVVAGVNAGYLMHIIDISGTHGNAQTITVDETMPTGSSTSRARFERWKKLGTITSSSIYEKFVNVGIDSSFIQFKVEMRGRVREMEVSELVSTSKSSLTLK